MMRLNFRVEARSPGTRARAARFQTLHNDVLTPLFMPVGTQATVRGQNRSDLLDSGSQILLANTYHLIQRPGTEVFDKFGGIHRFMNWPRSVLTDSGGFQIFSLPHARQIHEEGALFRSYVDGREILLSPETSIAAQRSIGSDIMMVLDECIPSTAPHSEAKRAMELTHRWARRSLQSRGESPQALFGIVQGACFEDLRRQSAEVLSEMPFDGMAIGGLAVGETKSQREDFCEFTAGLLPEDKPRYLMGVGTPIDLLEAVHRGVDMFDCILPHALSQQGVAYTSHGRLRVGRGVYRLSDDALDKNCSCSTCQNFSRGYLHHLIKANEPQGTTLIGRHNIYFYHQLMSQMRQAIFDQRFVELYRRLQPVLSSGDYENPVEVPKPRKRRERLVRLGRFEVHENPQTKRASVRDLESGEIMHSVNDPDEEARRLYVEAAQVAKRLQTQDLLKVWDVGLGAAHNAMALVREFETSRGPHSRLQILSFECDLDPLRLTLENPQVFRHIRHAGPVAIATEHRFERSGMEWELALGDFWKSYSQKFKPDLVFFDPFSLKSNPVFWTEKAFQELMNFWGPDHPVWMYTYSASTRVRAALLKAGFYVGYGPSSGPKESTTVALTPAALRGSWTPTLLGTEWVERWKRSEFFGSDDEKGLLRHPQFRLKS